jgi:hypothetical protein
VVLKPYILKVSFSLLLGVIKDIRQIESKYPPDIIGFCETIFHENISNDSLNINGFAQERKDKTANCGGGWYISQNLEYKRKLIRWVFRLQYIVFCFIKLTFHSIYIM